MSEHHFRFSGGRGRCRCRKTWTGQSYEQVEDKWRQHVHEATGRAPRPFGNQTARWTP